MLSKTADPQTRPTHAASLVSLRDLRELMQASYHSPGLFAELPARLADALDASAVVFHWRHLDHSWEILASSGGTPMDESAYVERYAALHPWLQAAIRRGGEQRFRRVEDDTPRVAFRRSAFHRLFLASRAWDCGGAAVLSVRTDVGVGVLLVCYDIRRGAPNTAAMRRLAGLRACAVELMCSHGQMAARRRLPGGSTRPLAPERPVMSLVVDEAGQVLHLSASASEYLGRQAGLWLCEGRLIADGEREVAQLTRAVQNVVASSGGGAQSLRLGDGSHTTQLRLERLPGHFSRPLALAVIHAGAGSGYSGSEPILPLSHDETRLAEGLRRGLTLRRLAASLCEPQSVVRARVASLMGKLGGQPPKMLSSDFTPFPAWSANVDQYAPLAHP